MNTVRWIRYVWVLTLTLSFALPGSAVASGGAPVRAAAPAAGTVVALQGTPHLWIADEAGVLHWGGDTRGLGGHFISWGNRIEVGLDALRSMQKGDPWLSAGLLKDGEPIYLVKWETSESVPRLLHIQSIGDVELFGINATNYGNFVIDRAAWEAHFGISAAGLQRAELVAAAPPAQSNVLYQASWSGGMGGWTGTRDWKTVGGMLVNDGTSYSSVILAPYRVTRDNFAVEAEIQGVPGFYAFALVLRWDDSANRGYWARIGNSDIGIKAGCGDCSFGDNIGDARQFDQGQGWHTYRFEASGNTLRLFVDGAPWLERTDNRYLTARQAGLWVDRSQISVRSFKIIAL